MVLNERMALGYGGVSVIQTYDPAGDGRGVWRAESVGTISQLEQATTAAVAPVEEAHTYVHEQAVAHLDETSWRQGASGPGCGSRDELGDRVLGADVPWWPRGSRVVGRDVRRHPGDGPLQCLQLVPGAVASAVWAHCSGISKRCAPVRAAPRRLARPWRRRTRCLPGGIGCARARSTIDFRSYMSPLRRDVERLLEAGSRCGMRKTVGTCRDILQRREALWTFVQVAGVEPTNNVAERWICPGVLWRKERWHAE